MSVWCAFYPSTFRPRLSVYLKWNTRTSRMQCVIEPYVIFHTLVGNLCLLVGIIRPLRLIAVIDMLGLKRAILLFCYCLFSLHFVYQFFFPCIPVVYVSTFFRIQFLLLSVSFHVAFLVTALAITLHKLITINGCQCFTSLSEVSRLYLPLPSLTIHHL